MWFEPVSTRFYSYNSQNVLQLLDQALASPVLNKFLVADKIAEVIIIYICDLDLSENYAAQYRGFGGVRIEDDIVVTAAGHELLTQVRHD